MKKFLFAAGLLIMSQQLFAQLEKGMISVGLTSSLKASKTENEYNYTNGAPNHYYSNNTVKNTSFNIAPSASYFLSSKFAVGAQVGYIGYVTKTEYTDKYNTPAEMDYTYSKTTSGGINVTPYVKYYFSLSDNVHFFLKGSVGFSNSRGETSGYDETTLYDGSGNVTSTVRSNEYGPNKTKTLSQNIGISPGLLFMPSQKIGIEFSLGNVFGATSSTSKTTDDNGNTSKYTTTNLEYFNFNTISVGTGIYYFFK